MANGDLDLGTATITGAETGLSERIRRREVSPVEVIEAPAARIERAMSSAQTSMSRAV